MSDTVEDTEKVKKENVKVATSSEKGALTDEKKEGAVSDKKQNSTSPVVNFAGFDIDSKNHLADLDSGDIKAYKAIARRGGGNYIAYVSEPGLMPRHNKTEVYQSIINPNLAKLEKHGAVYWPPAKQERYVFIYEDNLGKKLLKPGEEQALGFKNDVVMDRILKPFSGILQDFRDRDFIHGNIRATNLYNGGSSKLTRMVLGDCLTAPSGYAQSAVYEPIERAMADPIARGPGTRESDMYAFGVLLAVLLRSTDPLAKLSESDIIKRKIDVGSYVAVTGKDRFTGPILELLRGLLHDDVSQRWTIDETLAWLDGRRLSPKQVGRKLVAPRPIVFSNKKYFQINLLAMDFEKNPQELKRLIEDGEMKNWINRAIEQPEIYARIEDSVSLAKGNGQTAGYEERLVTYVSMAVDNMAPIRFSNAHFIPDGVGSALAEAVALKKDLNIYAELFMQNIVISWVKAQTNPNIDIGAIISKFDNCRNFVRQKNAGFGLERCLYLLNPEARCMSDKVKNYYVLSPEDLMYAFEDLTGEGKGSGLFIDRHIAAFLSVKDGKNIDQSLPEINAIEHYKKVQANLVVLANIQRRSQLPYFPGIAKALASQLGVVYKRYHDRTIRDKLKKNIDKFAQEGDLIKMAAVLENPEVQQKDFLAFKRAMKEYADFKAESQRLEAGLLNKEKFGLATGQEIAAVISSVLAGLVILLVAFVYVSEGSVF